MLAVVLASVLVVGSHSSDCGSRRLMTSPENPSIVLDDADAAGKGWSEGNLPACLEDAYRGTFRHDNSSEKGSISATYTFDPPKDGCYVIEEYHPGQNAACSQRLPTNARIDVDWCKGRSSYTHVDQSLRGGQWNILGALPFYMGWQGKIRVTNSGTGSTCKLGQDCLWVADAFKVTWVSDGADGCKVPMSYVAGNEQEVTTTFTTTVASSVQVVPAPVQAAASSVQAEPEVMGREVVTSAMNIVHQALVAMQTVVDDVSAKSTTTWQRSDCGMGWKQSTLYQDPWSGSAVEFVFNPPSDGCYIVEEFHPQNLCGRALSSVSLSIHYCKGLQKNAQVDQSKDGNRWNTLGTFPFFKGTPGKVFVTHPRTGSHPAVADAFRFTRISSSCGDARQASIHYHRLSQNAAAIIVDNHHALQHSQVESSKCFSKAIGGNLHAASVGEAEARFDFIPTSTGCYRVDSFHPENDEGEACAELADGAALEVNWCLGRQTKLTTPLKGHGNRWKTIGHFKFFAGEKGGVISRRLSQTPMGKLWVADAFRFTKVSEACDAIPDVGHFSFHITGEELQKNETGITSFPDMRMALHEAVVEATQLPLESVQLLSIRKGSVIADFEVRGSLSVVTDIVSKMHAQVSPGSESALKQALCKAVTSSTKAQCDVTVMQTSVLPGPPGNKEEALQANDDDDRMFLGVCIAAGLLVVIATTFVMCCLARQRFKQAKTEEANATTVIHVASKDELPAIAGKEVVPEEEEISHDAEKGKPACDECSQSGSTATPTSFDQDGNIDLEVQSLSEEPQETEVSV